MICKICHEDIEEKHQCNISPISNYPVCEDCKDEIMCDKCCDNDNLYYVEDWDKILCRDCLVDEAVQTEQIHTVTHYYTQEYSEICSDADLEPVIDHLKEFLEIEEVN